MFGGVALPSAAPVTLPDALVVPGDVAVQDGARAVLQVEAFRDDVRADQERQVPVIVVVFEVLPGDARPVRFRGDDLDLAFRVARPDERVAQAGVRAFLLADAEEHQGLAALRPDPERFRGDGVEARVAAVEVDQGGVRGEFRMRHITENAWSSPRALRPAARICWRYVSYRAACSGCMSNVTSRSTILGTCSGRRPA